MSSDRDTHVRSGRESANSPRSRSADSYRSIAESEQVDIADKIAAAIKLAKFDRQAAVRILQGIIADKKFAEDDRWDAAEALSQVDPAAAAEAFYNIANDEAVDPSTRMSAADKVAELEG